MKKESISMIDGHIDNEKPAILDTGDRTEFPAAAWNILWAVQMTIKRPDLCDVPEKEEGERKE